MLITYFLVILVTIFLFGFNFFISLLGNILLLLFLIPLLLFLMVLIGFNSFKSQINTCSNCGSISFGKSNTCINCGTELDIKSNTNKINMKPSEKTIEIKAEEIK